MSTKNQPESKPVKILKGREARSIREEGKRKYGPFRIRLEVQMSRLAISNDTLEFFCYQETGEKALQAVSWMLNHLYVETKLPFDGYPKPNGKGYALPISDEEFRMTWQQARDQGRELELMGDQRDPVAFHIRPRNTKIIIP